MRGDAPDQQLVRPLLLVVPGRTAMAGGESASRRDRRRRGLDQRALLHHRRHEGVLPRQGARAPQGVGRREGRAGRPRAAGSPRPGGAAETDSRRWPSCSTRRPVPTCATASPTTSRRGPRAAARGARLTGHGLVLDRHGSAAAVVRRRAHRHGAAGRRRRARPVDAVEDAARQGRRQPRRPVRSSTTTTTRSPRSPGCSRRCSSPTTRPPSCWSSPAAGRWSPSGSAGPRAATSPSTCSSSASATTTKQGRRARPRPDLPVGRVARPRRRGRHLVDGDARGVGQAHRRRLQGPARGRPALDRDHRQRGRRAAARPRGSTRCPPTRRSRWPSSRCGSSTGSCSCSTPRRRPSSACCRSGRPSTTRATASTGCASSPWSS